MKFEWDDSKNKLNHIKHGVSFKQAKKANAKEVIEYETC